MESADNSIALSNVLVDELVGEGWAKEVFVNPSDFVITSHYNDDDAALITYIEVIVEQVSSSDQYQIFVEYCNFSESVRGIPFVRV